jgi:D-tagatose-1,6-bisphosphate aldolase subunit GatZ/KbaZ
MKSAEEIFLKILEDNRKGTIKGIYSVCSAHADVLEACFIQAKKDNSILLIESTSNQVDQFGGYTGMKPAGFVHYVHTIAQKTGFPAEMVLLGGDHLGPNVWQNLPAKVAMSNAKTLIEAYVNAGYLKIHLDTSMFCADDPGDRSKPLSDEIVASRAAELCQVAEQTWTKYYTGNPVLLYVIGTEVPVPGGAQQEENEVNPTRPEDAERTITIIRRFFLDAGLANAWDRVIGLVVQPGVEFGDDQIFTYQQDKARNLSNIITRYNNLVFEAHSTDYQSESSLKALVKDHFCILKVGPWLTFAYREALFALENMESELLGAGHPDLSDLKNTLDNVMLEDPNYWKNYYSGEDKQKQFKRKYSFSDRSRYYWTHPNLNLAKNRLFENLRKNRIPLSLLSQFMPIQFYQVCEDKITTDPADLVFSYIRTVIAIYSRACGMAAQ